MPLLLMSQRHTLRERGVGKTSMQKSCTNLEGVEFRGLLLRTINWIERMTSHSIGKVFREKWFPTVQERTVLLEAVLVKSPLPPDDIPLRVDRLEASHCYFDEFDKLK